MGGGSHPSMAPASTYPRLASKPVGKQIHKLYLDRLRQFTDNGQYRNQGLLPYILYPYHTSSNTEILIYEQ
jgi:alpha-mannosidase